MARGRALACALGAAAFTAALLCHPLVLDPRDETGAYRAIVAYPAWPAVHWVALLGLAAWTLALAADAPPAARQARGVARGGWAVVLSFEATALPQLARASLPGFWTWTLAAGYVGAAFDGLGLALLGAATSPVAAAAGGAVVLAAPVAYARPGAAVPVLAVAGAAALLATAAIVRRRS
jgi:hypothetical protein